MKIRRFRAGAQFRARIGAWPGMIAALALCAVPVHARQPDRQFAATATVRAFYKFHFSHDQTFTPKTLVRRRKWLTPELYDLLRYELERDTPKDEPPEIEGDPFTDSQEGPTSFRIA